ncbi:GGDEF domain-containing protein [Silvimonas soli]|uniref:GGDEF domain-containing protein n=1 Tax=Silvimonas soli TaxID=2980100 RepID=UPI0024B3870F|nr:GGDEF domain-containing protein [Silvimonas soli]
MENLNTFAPGSALDQITGLHSRHQFFCWAEPLVRDQLPYAVLVLNLEHFKQITDTGGYDAGDIALALVADVLRASLRNCDIAARLDRDEFVIGLWQATQGYAQAVALRIHSVLANQSISFLDRTIRCTVHIGVAASFPDLEAGMAGVANRADEALARARQSGRGQAVLAGA